MEIGLQTRRFSRGRAIVVASQFSAALVEQANVRVKPLARIVDVEANRLPGGHRHAKHVHIGAAVNRQPGARHCAGDGSQVDRFRDLVIRVRIRRDCDRIIPGAAYRVTRSGHCIERTISITRNGDEVRPRGQVHVEIRFQAIGFSRRWPVIVAGEFDSVGIKQAEVGIQIAAGPIDVDLHAPARVQRESVHVHVSPDADRVRACDGLPGFTEIHRFADLVIRVAGCDVGDHQPVVASAAVCISQPRDGVVVLIAIARDAQVIRAGGGECEFEVRVESTNFVGRSRVVAECQLLPRRIEQSNVRVQATTRRAVDVERQPLSGRHVNTIDIHVDRHIDRIVARHRRRDCAESDGILNLIIRVRGHQQSRFQVLGVRDRSDRSWPPLASTTRLVSHQTSQQHPTQRHRSHDQSLSPEEFEM